MHVGSSIERLYLLRGPSAKMRVVWSIKVQQKVDTVLNTENTIRENFHTEPGCFSQEKQRSSGIVGKKKKTCSFLWKIRDVYLASSGKSGSSGGDFYRIDAALQEGMQR
jgi:hypothetical protein